MNDKLPIRKSPRIPGYDYAKENYYFVTICAHEKRCIFGSAERLSAFGSIAAEELSRIPERFPGVKIDKSAVMPNHIHAIIVIGCENRKIPLPSLNVVVGQYKSGVTRRIHELDPDATVWQRSYHDHVIRDRAGYEKIWQYIDTNPQRWSEDCFFPEQVRNP